MAYTTHPDLYEPKLSQQLWRYMNFSKFVALIQNKKLYFPSLIQFIQNDPWEGLLPPSNYNPDLPLTHINKEGTAISSTLAETFGEHFPKFVKDNKSFYSKSRPSYFVNCWHMNDSESDSQWRIYGDQPESVAIVSNFESIKKSILDHKIIYGSEVRYYNQIHGTVSGRNAFHSVAHKRMAFSHEREFRLIYRDSSPVDELNILDGVYIDTNLEALILKVVISPRAPAFFIDVIKNLIKIYGFNFEYTVSDLYKVIE